MDLACLHFVFISAVFAESCGTAPSDRVGSLSRTDVAGVGFSEPLKTGLLNHVPVWCGYHDSLYQFVVLSSPLTPQIPQSAPTAGQLAPALIRYSRRLVLTTSTCTMVVIKGSNQSLVTGRRSTPTIPHGDKRRRLFVYVALLGRAELLRRDVNIPLVGDQIKGPYCIIWIAMTILHGA
jgi:hypothetical protein